jgi:hypothetical protein
MGSVASETVPGTVVVEESAFPVYLRCFLFVVIPGLGLVFGAVWLLPVGPISAAWQALYISIVIACGFASALGTSGVRKHVAIDSWGVHLRHAGRPRVDNVSWEKLRPPESVVLLGQVRFGVAGRFSLFVTPGVARAIVSSRWAPRWNLRPALGPSLEASEQR